MNFVEIYTKFIKHKHQLIDKSKVSTKYLGA